MSVHPLLARQMRRLGLDTETPPERDAWQALLTRVSQAYRDHDGASELAGRALETVSEEMRQQYEDLRLRSEAALSEERDTLHAIIGSMADGLCLLDRAGRVLLINQEAARLTGTAPDAAVGHDLVQLGWVSLAEGERLRRACVQAIESRHAERVDDLHLRAGNGAVLPVSCAITPILHEGRGGGLVLALRDESPQRRASADLVRARGDAEAATRAKSEFLAAMSHELRTPLTGIVGMAGLLLETTLDAAQQEYAATVKNCAEGLVASVSDLLDLSKIEAGRLNVEHAPFVLHDLLDDAIGMVGDGACKRGLELLCEVDEGVPAELVGDGPRIRQVLVNLLSNAVKFTPRGEIGVHVSAGGGGEDAARDLVTLRFEVTDTGVGIAPEAQPRLFDGYNPLDGWAARPVGRTGLGLAITKRLLGLMGGTIEVRSQLGVGSVFVACVPVAVASTPRLVGRSGHLPAGARVLCVDDNARQRQHLAAHVTALGLRASVAADAIAAFDALRQAARDGDPIGTVLLDVALPHVMGLDLARWVRAEPSIAATGLVLLTPVGDRTPVADDAALRMAGRLTKPVRREALIDALARSLGSSERTERSRTTRRVAAGAGRRVLVAEDNAVNQRVIVAQLRRLGFYPDLVRNGIEAVAAAATGRYDIVLMDCQMPEMDGYDATRAIRRLHGDAGDVPIVALTASALPGDRERCFEAGMNAFIAKPVDHERLADALDRCLPTPAA